MKAAISRLTLAGVTFAMTSAPLLAQSFWPNWFPRPRPVGEPVRSVPEIDASAGLLAVAAVLVVLAFVWERRRRAA
jgi:hypothetical protein